jgi:aspartate/methionine/tyrosine aminotransferase
MAPFALERYFAQYEFSAQYLLSSSDCEGLLQQRLLGYADSETRALWENLQLGYTESLGHPLLRAEISHLYRSIAKDEVLVVTPEEGIFVALQVMLEKGDHVICTFPGYQSLYSIAESLGCEVTKWLPREDEGWRFDPTDLERQIKPNTKVIVVNFPHNPTGYLPSPEVYERIIKIAKARNIFLFSDEMYRFLEYDAADRLASACDLYENAISLFGMSKTFGMAGVRIGWLTTKNKELYSQFATYKDFTTICSSAPSEILSLIALRARSKIIAANLDLIGGNLFALEAFMHRNGDLLSWVKPKAGTICFPRLKIDLSSYDFCERVVNETGIMMLPSRVYGFGDHHIRIGFGRKNFQEVLGIFEEYLQRKFR